MSSDQMPACGNTKLIKFSPSRAGKDVKCPGYARGGEVEASIWLIYNVKVRQLFNWLAAISSQIFPPSTVLALNLKGWEASISRQRRTSCSSFHSISLFSVNTTQFLSPKSQVEKKIGAYSWKFTVNGSSLIYGVHSVSNTIVETHKCNKL